MILKERNAGTRPALLAALLASLFLPLVSLSGQNRGYFLVAKGQVFSQSSTATPVPVTTGGAVFDAEAPGFGGPALISGASVTLPGGGTRALAYSQSTTFYQFTDTLNTVTALDAAYPAGHYVITLTSTILPGLTAGITSPPDTFPAPPQVLNLSAAQAVNSTNDFTLLFQPFTGAAAPDDAALEVYDNGTLRFSDSIPLTDSSYLITAKQLDPGKTYEGRLRFRHMVADNTVFPAPAFGFFTETRFPLATLTANKTLTLISATPSTGVTLNSPTDGILFVFSAAMNPQDVAIQWTATLNGAPFPLTAANFTYSWTGPPALTCSYAPQNGGWPPGLLVTWTLSPTAGNPSNFADTQGKLLAVNTYTGSFLTPGAPCNCPQTVVAAPDWAPGGLAGNLFTVTVTDGRAPFVSSGVYQLFTSLAGSNHVVLGNAGAGMSLGTYTYTKTGTNSGVVALVDAQAGAGLSLQLTYASPTTGGWAVANAASQVAQRGTFSMNNYGQLQAPGMLAANYTNAQFQAYVSGQEGLIYSVETSPDLASWSTMADLLMTNLTSGFSDASAARVGDKFYRARVKGSALAPDSMVGKTLNFSIAGGGAPLAAHGTYQWLAANTGAVYQVQGMTATTNSTGGFTYTKASPDSGRLVWADAKGGASPSLQLAFSSTTTGFYYASLANSIGTQWGAFTMADGPVLFLGNIQFATDTKRVASLNFAADGNPATLSVTNADGYIWKLSFPADALLDPRTISMTPFATIDSSASVLPLVSGVLLEPDGIQFANGVTLSVTAPKVLGTHAALMLANHDGSNLHFVMSTNQGNTYTTTLFHFTSGTVSDPRDEQLPQLEAQIRAILNQAESEARALKRPVVVPPEPPDYDWDCDPSRKDAQAQQVDAYIKNLFAREDQALRHLLSAARDLSLVTGEHNSEAIILALDVMDTAYARKVDTLFRTYQGNIKKFNAVTKTALTVMRQDQLLGGTARTDWWDNIKAWVIRTRDYYFDQFRSGHDYSKVAVCLQLERQAALLGESSDGSQFLNNLQNALAFKLTVKIDLASPAGGPGITESAQGNITLQADDLFNMSGAGTINITSGQLNPVTPVKLPSSWSQQAFIAQFDACKDMTAVIALEAIIYQETWLWPPPTGPLTELILGQYFAGAFIKRKQVDGGFGFPVSLQNKNAQAANQSLTKTYGGENVTVTLTLQHTPK